MEPGSGAAWTAGQVARHLGIAESTLRSWHRRYGIGPHGSKPGRYRHYTEADVARLRRMLELIKLGMLASDAARTVEAGEPDAVSAEQDVADVLTAARASDSERCGVVLDTVMARRGVVEAWETVCRPALAIVDADQRVDPDCMDIEHALSWAILGALHRVPRPPIAPGTSVVLLACVESEHHTLPLAALAAALAGYRIPVHMLGAATPTQSLVRAVRDVGPGAVVLWAQRPETADLRVVQSLLPYPVRLLTAGPGWPAAGLESIEYLTSLRHALTVLAGSPADPGHPDAPGRGAGPGSPLAPPGDPGESQRSRKPQPSRKPQTPRGPQQPPESQPPGEPQPPQQPQQSQSQSARSPQTPREPQLSLQPRRPRWAQRLAPPVSPGWRFPPFPTGTSTSPQ